MADAYPPLNVLFLWHQHQPFYKDLLSHRYEMPWVRLHATKDYFDMVALLDEFPKMRANFNLVPSLLAQLDDYAAKKAQDRFLHLTLKKAADLTFDDKQFILKNFFMANWDTMVDPYPRYRELLEKRGRSAHADDLVRVQQFFREQDWTDLQLWFNLAWFDPYWRDQDPFINGLFAKGKGFTQEEKQRLTDKQADICGRVAAKHKELQDRGQIEITATPFYHPILPLLCDTEEARMAMPDAQLPARFQHPEDAAEQIERAAQDHHNRFGRRPRGFWPSEGSVSEAVASLFMNAGVRWIATDEAILARSLKSGDYTQNHLYQPWTLKRGGKDLHFFFRDHTLSDAIGFVYATWDPKDAAQDFIQRLKTIRASLIEADGKKPQSHVVSVILDGENCWEYYKDDGRLFLRELYRLLSETPELVTVCASDYLDRHPPANALPNLWSGSWINSNFAIWIGHSEDNRAWDLLKRTREFLKEHFASAPATETSEPGKLAWEEILIAEGSDWCWWYGDDHSSANDEAFDWLFRKHLMNVYSLLGAKPPEDLHLPIKALRKENAILPPTEFIAPKIDGLVTSYFEWISAGIYHTEAGTMATMHRAQNFVKSIYFGSDLETLYIRIDLSRSMTAQQLQGHLFKLIFLNPSDYEVVVQITETGLVQVKTLSQGAEQTSKPPAQGAYKKVLELALPLADYNLKPGDHFEFSVILSKGDSEQERWPIGKTISLPYPTPTIFSDSWRV